MLKNTIQEGFAVNLEISNIGSIKPVASGSFKNDNGELVKYKASIQFRTTNIEEVEDEELGFKEIETHLEVKIPCEDTKHVKQLNIFLRGLKSKGQVFNLKTTLPRQSDTNIYKVVSTLNALEFIDENTEKTDFTKGAKPKEDEKKK